MSETKKKEKKKKLKSLIIFKMPIKSTTTTGREGRKRKEKKKSKRIYGTSQNVRIIVFLESLLSESFPSLGVTVHLTSLGCPPTVC